MKYKDYVNTKQQKCDFYLPSLISIFTFMLLLYTGAKKFEDEQPISYLSLGDYISSSEVQNDVLSNIFGEISKYTKQQNKAEYRLIALYNDEDVEYTNLRAFIDYGDDQSDSGIAEIVESEIQLGWTAVKIDACGDLYVGKLATGYSKPYGITFYPSEGEENALPMPNLEPGSYLILALKRTLNPVSLTDEEICEISEGTVTLDSQENISLEILWD